MQKEQESMRLEVYGRTVTTKKTIQSSSAQSKASLRFILKTPIQHISRVIMSYWHHFFGYHSSIIQNWLLLTQRTKIHFLFHTMLFGFSSKTSCQLYSWMTISSASKAAFVNWDFSLNTMILKSAMFFHMLVSRLSCMPPAGSSLSLQTNVKILTLYVSSGLEWSKNKTINSFSHSQLPWSFKIVKR